MEARTRRRRRIPSIVGENVIHISKVTLWSPADLRDELHLHLQ